MSSKASRIWFICTFAHQISAQGMHELVAHGKSVSGLRQAAVETPWLPRWSGLGACLDVWVEDPVDVAKQGTPAAAGARGGLLTLLNFLTVQKLLVPLIDLLLATHQVVLPQYDIALVVLHQQPAHVCHHKDEEPKGKPGQEHKYIKRPAY